MIYGVGTDLVSLKRIVRLNKKFGMSFGERFAAKEAFAKAVGTGIRGAVTFRNVGVGHDALGKPEFFYAAPLAQWLKEQGIARVHLSMSDEEDTVSAFAVAEREAV